MTIFDVPSSCYLQAAQTLDCQFRAFPSRCNRVCSHLNDALTEGGNGYSLLRPFAYEIEKHWSVWCCPLPDDHDEYQPRILWLLLMAEAVKPSKKARK